MKDFSILKDEEIINLVCDKDKNIFSEIIKRYENKLIRYAYYLISGNDIAADVVQESFIKAFINLRSFDTKKKFSSWIYRIVHNEALNALDKKKRFLPIEENIDFHSGVDLEDDLIRKELVSRANDCLRKMSLKYSEPLTLFYLEDKSYEEISDILKVPIGTVGTRINRAKAIMKKICRK